MPVYQYRSSPTSTDDGLDSLDSLDNVSNETDLSHNAEAPIDAGVLINDARAITTGINWSLFHLLIHGLISLLWGIALAIFSSGIVPVTWAVSQYGQTHLVVTNVLITLVGTATTTHIQYISQGVLKQYSQYVLVNGFTVKELAWMQGIMEWSLYTNFGSWKKSWKKRAVWLVIYAGMAVHTASVVSILQPNIYYMNVYFNDPIPCATNPNNVSLAAAHNLPSDTQSWIDQLSFEIGLQLGNYNEQVAGNTTTSVAGRVYVKDIYAYGAIGGLSDGLQEIPGVSFNAKCTNDRNSNISSLSHLWGSVFPGRTPPTISTRSDGSQSFSDSSVPLQMRSIVSDTSFNLTGSLIGMYALVDPSGSGGLLMVNSTGDLLCCVWQAIPKLVSVQTVKFTAKSLGAQDSKTVPQLTGRAVLFTLQGMAAAVHLGADLDNRNPVQSLKFPPTSAVLQILLADGGKAALTSFNVYFNGKFTHHLSTAGIAVCDSKNRTIATHWRFGNNHNLGWVAIIWTIGMGILAVIAVMWFMPRPRVRGIKPLEIPYAVILGRVVTVDGIKDGSQMLRIRPRNTVEHYMKEVSSSIH